MRLTMPEVETDRLCLRPIEVSDAADLYAVYSDPSVMRFLTLHPHTNVDQTLHAIRTVFLPFQKRCVPQTWVIEWIQEDKVIGLLNVHTIEDDIGKVGYVLHRDYWNRGIMKEALPQLLKVAFTQLELHRIEAMYEPKNLASGSVLASCGFQQEGILRKYTKLSDDRYHDMVLAAILKDDYERSVQNG